MDIKKFNVQGPLLISPKMIGDSRGFFCERYRMDQFKEIGIHHHFIQDNYSRSSFGILRGLHYQWNESQSKLVTCNQGTILDVAVDIRAQSLTYGQVVMAELSGDKPEWLWVPAGFAHGFLVLSKEGADVSYKVDALWNAKGESGIRWNDPDLNISWPNRNPMLSDKDKVAPLFADYKMNPRF